MSNAISQLEKRPPTSTLRNSGFLITISGIDGSGKSSNAVALYNSLSQRGLPVSHAWAGYKPSFSYPFLALVRLLGYTRRIRVRGLTFFRREIRNNSAISRLWPLVLALDFVPSALISVALPLRRGRVVVCDRYVYDVVAELIQESTLGRHSKNILLNILPHPNLAFLMDVDENLAWDRSMVPGRAREQPYYDLGDRRRIYLLLAREYGLVVLNGGDDLEKNRAQILTQTLRAITGERTGWA